MYNIKTKGNEKKPRYNIIIEMLAHTSLENLGGRLWQYNNNHCRIVQAERI